MKDDWIALASIAFLIGIFAFSFFLLRRTIRKTGTVAAPTQDSRRMLPEEDKIRVARRLEREAQREQREAERLRQRDAYEVAKPSAYADKIRKREEERLTREAEELRSKQEQERKEAAEYEMWKSRIQVTDRGEDQKVDDRSQIQDFLDCFSNNRVVVLEDIASRFNLTTYQVIERLQNLEQANIVNGCLDDRGRYIPTEEHFIREVDERLKTCPDRVQTTDLQVFINGALHEQRSSFVK
jgi:hypothetical protein